MTRQKVRRKSRYWKLLLIFALLNMLAALIIVQYVYGLLLSYEAGTPNTALREFFQEVTAGNLESARRDAGFEDRIPEERDVFEHEIRSLYVGRDPEKLNYRRIASNDPDGRIVYAVYDEGEKLGEVFMYSTGEVSGTITTVDDFFETADKEIPVWKIVVPVEVEYLPPVTVRAMNSVTVLVDGTPLDSSSVIDLEALETDIFDNLPDGYSVVIPSVLTYEVQCSLIEPEITATGHGGEILEVLYDPENRHYDVVSSENQPVSAEEWEAHSARMISVAKAYALFISRDGTLYALNQYLYPGTDFALRMSGFDNQWYGAHSSYEFSELMVKDIVKYADNVFVGNLTFDFVVNFYSEIRTFESDYTLLFVQSGGQWLLADLRVA